jgi:pimeloyl-ACP methyl ester carboxylesterase
MSAQRIERASIGGISLGGLIAQNFAARHTTLVDRLILIDTTPRYSDEMWAERAATVRTKGVAAIVSALLNIWFSSDALSENSPGVRYVRETLSRASGEGYALACRGTRVPTSANSCRPSKRAHCYSAATMIFRAFSTPPTGFPATFLAPN